MAAQIGVGTGFFNSAAKIGPERRHGVMIDIDPASVIQPQDNDADSGKADNDNDSEKDLGSDYDVIDQNDMDPVICVHCDAVNKGESLYCCNQACGKILTQYTYDVSGNLD